MGSPNCIVKAGTYVPMFFSAVYPSRLCAIGYGMLLYLSTVQCPPRLPTVHSREYLLHSTSTNPLIEFAVLCSFRQFTVVRLLTDESRTFFVGSRLYTLWL